MDVIVDLDSDLNHIYPVAILHAGYLAHFTIRPESEQIYNWV